MVLLFYNLGNVSFSTPGFYSERWKITANEADRNNVKCPGAIMSSELHFSCFPFAGTHPVAMSPYDAVMIYEGGWRQCNTCNLR
jgi:hypothetical protein